MKQSDPTLNTSSTSTQDYSDKITEEDFQRLKNEYDHHIKQEQNFSSDWKLIQDKQHLRVLANYNAGNVLLFKAYMYLGDHISAELMKQYVVNLKKRKSWDDMYSHAETLEHIDEDTDIVYTVLKLPKGISSRDYVQIRKLKITIPSSNSTQKQNSSSSSSSSSSLSSSPFNQYMLIIKSCQHPSRPPTQQHVRGITHFHGYIFSDHGALFVMGQNDIGGRIPRWMANMAASRGPELWYRGFHRALQHNGVTESDHRSGDYLSSSSSSKSSSSFSSSSSSSSSIVKQSEDQAQENHRSLASKFIWSRL